MAVTFSAPLPALDNITLSGVANTCTQITVPDSAGKVTFRARANAAKLAWGQSLADGGALGAADYLTLPADTLIEIIVAGEGRTRAGIVDYYIASATASVVVEVCVEGARP